VEGGGGIKPFKSAEEPLFWGEFPGFDNLVLGEPLYPLTGWGVV